MSRFALWLLIVGALVAGCQAPPFGANSATSPTPSPTEASVGAPSSTSTPMRSPTPTATTITAPTKTAVPTDTAVATATVSAAATPSPRPSPGVANVIVDSPQANAEVSSPLHVTGRARAFEAMLMVDLMVDDVCLARQPVHASKGAPEWGDYSVDLTYTQPTAATNATLRAYTLSAKDGSVRDLVEVPLRLRAGDATPTPVSIDRYPLRLYFPREAPDELVFVGITREVPRTQAIGRAALDELLRGPTTFEQSQGLFSPFPAGSRVKSLRIENGTAYVDFDESVGRGGGSLRIRTIRRSVELTLGQFSTVQRVEITVEGDLDGLQP